MKLIDSHCHLDFEPLSNDLEGILRRARSAGIEKMVNIGSSLRSSEKSVKIAEQYPNIWATVGLHPHDADSILDFEGTMEKIKELAKNEKVVAIGEIGLDYFDAENQVIVSNTIKESQKKLFLAQIEIASEKKLPIVFHVRDAWDDFFTIISNFKFQISNSDAVGVVHCFTGDKNIIKKVIDTGFYIGFTGFVTFDQSKFEHIRDSVKITPIEKILIETDAPFLAPEPYRGKTNEPAFVLEVARKIAEIKNLNLGEVAKITSKNAEKLFNI